MLIIYTILVWALICEHLTLVITRSDKTSYCMGRHGPHTRYAKLRDTHAPGMPVTFYPSPISKETVSYRSRHASRHVRHTHVPRCMSGSLTRGDGENFPGIPGAWATRNVAYLVRGPMEKSRPLTWCWNRKNTPCLDLSMTWRGQWKTKLHL